MMTEMKSKILQEQANTTTDTTKPKPVEKQDKTPLPTNLLP